MIRGGSAASSVEADQKVREELNRILASKSFRQVDRLQHFLRFVVEETMAGRRDKLKEFPIGVEVFGKESSFDPRMDPIVRVQARRLRSRLERYYREEGQNDNVVIELPKGGYAPTFQHLESAAPRRSLASALVSRNTVVVRPFEDHSPASDQDHFCRGLGEEIIHTLSKVEVIRLVAWDRTHEPQEVASRLNAAMIVTGSVRKSRDTLRVTIHLIDAATGSYMWSECMDRKMDDVFTVQEDIAQKIRAKLEAEIVGGGSARRGKRPPENLAAHNFYLQGRYHLSQRTEEGLRKAADFFEKAIHEDQQYAPAYAGLADAYQLLGHYGVLPPPEVWTKAASNAAWAVVLDEDLAEAHTSLAHVKSTQDWDWLGAEREFQRAITLDPRYATAHHWYALSCLAPLARLDEALEEILQAHALDPISSIISRDVAVVYYYRRDFETALEQCDGAIEQNPHFSTAYLTLGLIQAQRGDLDESGAALQRAIQLSPQSPRMHSALGRTLAMSGKMKEALRIMSELHELSKRRYVSPFELASIHFAVGQVDEGFDWLTRAFQDRCFELVAIKVDPRFDALRGDPRFVALFNQLGLP